MTAPLPYYEDDAVTLYNARCEDVLPTLNLSGPVHLLTDPPYFGVKPDEWDNQWGKAGEFLAWMGEWLDLAKPHLGGDASVWVFASPEMTSAVERVVAERFRVLNTVRWLKVADRTQLVSLPEMRQFTRPWEGIVFAEQSVDPFGDASDDLHRTVFGPVGDYIKAERERAGVTRRELASSLTGYKNQDSANANIFNWELSKNLISARDYEAMRIALGPKGEYLRREWEDLRREWEHLRAEYEHLRRPFTVTNRKLSTDVWTFPSVAAYPGKHPCEKPEALIAHMIETTTRPGDTILDCFAGSGAILDTARQLGRKAVGIEMDRHWCDHAVRRLAQMTLPMMN